MVNQSVKAIIISRHVDKVDSSEEYLVESFGAFNSNHLKGLVNDHATELLAQGAVMLYYGQNPSSEQYLLAKKYSGDMVEKDVAVGLIAKLEAQE
ncbi:hypothetical protein HN747_00200 [archaeon]|jgi:hypothetical protein|nr:hypothetical protein [archaeon]